MVTWPPALGDKKIGGGDIPVILGADRYRAVILAARDQRELVGDGTQRPDPPGVQFPVPAFLPGLAP